MRLKYLEIGLEAIIRAIHFCSTGPVGLERTRRNIDKQQSRNGDPVQFVVVS
jgi:hypothetical protein